MHWEFSKPKILNANERRVFNSFCAKNKRSEVKGISGFLNSKCKTWKKPLNIILAGDFFVQTVSLMFAYDTTACKWMNNASSVKFG